MSENLQIAVDHDRDPRALIDMDHWADRQIVLHDALGAVAQVRADVARDVGRGLILDLSSGGCGQGPDQRDQRGRAKTLREAGVDEAGGAGATSSSPPKALISTVWLSGRMMRSQATMTRDCASATSER